MEDIHTTRKLAIATFAASLSAAGLACILLVVSPMPGLDGIIGAICVASLVAAAGYWGLAAIEERRLRREALLWRARLDLIMRSPVIDTDDVDDWQATPFGDDDVGDAPGFAAADIFGRAVGTPRPGSPRARRRASHDPFGAGLAGGRDVWVWRNGRWQRRVN